jgi:hypothetical protein
MVCIYATFNDAFSICCSAIVSVETCLFAEPSLSIGCRIVAYLSRCLATGLHTRICKTFMFLKNIACRTSIPRHWKNVISISGCLYRHVKHLWRLFVMSCMHGIIAYGNLTWFLVEILCFTANILYLFSANIKYTSLRVRNVRSLIRVSLYKSDLDHFSPNYRRELRKQQMGVYMIQVVRSVTEWECVTQQVLSYEEQACCLPSCDVV